MKNTFVEKQKFTQWWLWLILISTGILILAGLYKQLFNRETFGENPLSNFKLIILLILLFSIIILFSMMKLETLIDKDGIQMTFFPFIKKKINWDEIKNIELLNYGFVGGWGIRLWTKYGTVYNIKGNKGLFIELKNGNKFLIGTQQETKLDEIIKTVGNIALTS